MPQAHAADGAGIHWTERGAGPAVLLTPYWSMHPSVYDPLESALEADVRVVSYDQRGTGGSDRVGPYDMETGASDLEAVLEAAGGAEVAVCLVDASSFASPVAQRRPDLLRTVVCVGSAPFGVGALSSSNSLIASQAVIGAFLQQIETDYRGAVRSALTAANANLPDDRIRERVTLQVDYASGESAAARARAWAADEAGAVAGEALGDRLQVILTETMGGGESWFPAAHELEPIIRKAFPQAGISWTSDGIVSAPAECAEAIRTVMAAEPKGPKTWILTGGVENFRIYVERGFDVIGFKEGRRRQAEELEPGDEIVFYVSGVQAFGAIAKVRSAMFEDREPIWPSKSGRKKKPEAYPWRVEAELDVVLDEAELVPAESLVGELDHIAKWPAEHWHLAFQGQLRTVGSRDATRLRSRIEAAARAASKA